MTEQKREIMAETEEILETMFFGANPVFDGVMTDNVKPFFSDREEQLRVLLGIFALNEYRRMAEMDKMREAFVASLLTPQAGELAH